MTGSEHAQQAKPTEGGPSVRGGPGLRLIGISMVRDEVDIIDDWMDHALSLLDGIAVVAHNCSDGTLERLVARARSGAPLVILAQNSETFRQGETLTEVARKIVGRFRPDWIFALDADEFVVAESRGALEAALRGLPTGTSGLLPWRTYLPPMPGPGPLKERALRCLEDEPAPQSKVVFPYSVLADARVVLVEGSHGVARLDQAGLVPLPHARLPGAYIAHLPVRSDQQLRRKVIGGEQAIRPIRLEGSSMAWHWAELAARLKREPALSGEALDDITLRYYAFAGANGACENLPVHRVILQQIGL